MHQQPRDLVPLPSPPGLQSILYSSSPESEPRRLVLFVHGFNGRAAKTWHAFAQVPTNSSWWDAADLIFVGYDSLRYEVGGVAYALREWLRHLHPLPMIADRSIFSYDELILVGHSLGGVVLRMMLLAEHKWGSATPGSLLNQAEIQTRLVLFSPATAGFLPTGFLSLARSTSLWGVVQAALNVSPAYNVLANHHDNTLRQLEVGTEQAVHIDPHMKALQVQTLWANPDGVVLVRSYPSDFPSRYVLGRNHITMCKPDAGYRQPWKFVETGELS